MGILRLRTVDTRKKLSEEIERGPNKGEEQTVIGHDDRTTVTKRQIAGKVGTRELRDGLLGRLLLQKVVLALTQKQSRVTSRRWYPERQKLFVINTAVLVLVYI